MEVYEGTAVQIQVHSLHVTRHIMMYGNITSKRYTSYTIQRENDWN